MEKLHLFCDKAARLGISVKNNYTDDNCYSESFEGNHLFLSLAKQEYKNDIYALQFEGIFEDMILKEHKCNGKVQVTCATSRGNRGISLGYAGDQLTKQDSLGISKPNPINGTERYAKVFWKMTNLCKKQIFRSEYSCCSMFDESQFPDRLKKFAQTINPKGKMELLGFFF